MIARNAGLILAARLVAPAASFALVYLLAAFAGVEPVGQFNTCMAVLAVFQIFGGLGLDNYLTREVARDMNGTRDLVRSALRAVLPLSLLAPLAAVLAAVAIGYPVPTIQGIAAGSPVLLAGTLLAVLDAAFIGLARAPVVALVACGESVLRVTLSALVIYFKPDVRLLLGVFAATRFAALVFYWPFLRRLPRGDRPASRPSWHFLRGIAPFVGILALYAIFWRADILFLSRFRGDHAAGVYSMAQKVVMIFFLVPSSLVSAALPRLASSGGAEALGRIFDRVLSALSFYIIPVTLALVLRGRDLFALLRLGPAFDESGRITAILALLVAIMSLIELCFRTLLAAGLEAKGLAIALRSLLVGLALTGTAARYGGAEATAWGMVAAACVDLAQSVWVVRTLVSGVAKTIRRSALTTLALVAVLVALRHVPLLAFLGIALLAHFALSLAAGLLRWSDIWTLLHGETAEALR